MNWTCEEIADGALIERYLSDRLSESETEQLESHCLTCARCATDLRLGLVVRKALSQPDQSTARPPLEVVAPSDRRARRWLAGRTAAALAAAAVLAGLLLVWPSRLDDESSRTRREEGTADEAGPVLAMPVGEVARPEEFRWSPVTSADLYRVTVYDAAGDVVWETETQDTLLIPPAATQFAAGSRYYWKVAARVGWDRWVNSDLREFKIEGREPV